MNRGIIIQGSSRIDGHTAKVVEFVKSINQFEVVALKSLHISPYDYHHKNNDDFIPLMQRIANDHDTIIFATPVYWYAMSGLMKNFFDRFTDCLKVHKEIGYQLRGKNMALISCSGEQELNDGFTVPFSASANYLGMHYLGNVHAWLEEGSIPKQLKQKLEKAARNWMEI